MNRSLFLPILIIAGLALAVDAQTTASTSATVTSTTVPTAPATASRGVQWLQTLNSVASSVSSASDLGAAETSLMASSRNPSGSAEWALELAAKLDLLADQLRRGGKFKGATAVTTEAMTVLQTLISATSSSNPRIAGNACEMAAEVAQFDQGDAATAEVFLRQALVYTPDSNTAAEALNRLLATKAAVQAQSSNASGT